MNDKQTDKTPPEAPGSPEKAPEKPTAEPLDLRIEKLVTGGAGLGRHEGMAVFAPLTAPGDLARVQLVEQRKGFAQARLEELLEPGPGRREAPCPHFGQCGGCDLQHLDIATQRQAKADIVADCFQRLGKMDISEMMVGPEATGRDEGYRNRIRLYANLAGHYGMMRRGTHDVVPLEACLLMPEEFNRDILPWLRMLPPVEEIVVRLDGRGGWLVSIFGPPNRLRLMKKILSALPQDEAPGPGCKGLLFNNLPIWGRDHLLYEVAGHTFRVGAQSFFQGNLEVTEEAVRVMREWIGELAEAGKLGGMLGDLFCGAGLFSLSLADLFEKVVALDSDPYACRDAGNNVQRDAGAAGKVTVHKGPLAVTLGNAELAAPEEWREACCVIDPPRTGLGKDGVKALLKAGPRQVIYMSCDPATLARDVAGLVAGGYELRKLRVLDMFPQTAHIETVVLVERGEK